MESHEWRERTDDGIRYYRASHHGVRWTIRTTLKTDPDWEDIPLDQVSEDLWRALRDVVWRKYQRRRCAWDRVAELDRILGEDPPAGGRG
jgi:hypothetical protein